MAAINQSVATARKVAMQRLQEILKDRNRVINALKF